MAAGSTDPAWTVAELLHVLVYLWVGSRSEDADGTLKRCKDLSNSGPRNYGFADTYRLTNLRMKTYPKILLGGGGYYPPPWTL